MRLNLGCGPVKFPGWVNVDYAQECKPDLVADVRHLPLEEGVADEVYASHLLEHFGCEEPVLEEWHRVLKPGGKITVIVPDLIGTVYLWRFGGSWGNDKVIDLAYVNATAFGAQILGPEWSDASHTHKQIFVLDMLVERMRPLFPDAHQEAATYDRHGSIAETIVVGTKA